MSTDPVHLYSIIVEHPYQALKVIKATILHPGQTNISDIHTCQIVLRCLTMVGHPTNGGGYAQELMQLAHNNTVCILLFFHYLFLPLLVCADVTGILTNTVMAGP